MNLFLAGAAAFLSFALSAGANDFLSACRDQAEQAAMRGTSVVEGQDGWLFFVPELRHLGAGEFWGPAAEKVSRATRADARDPLPAILAFHEELAKRNIRLLIVPVPPKAVIYSDKLPLADPTDPSDRTDHHHQHFYAILSEAGMDVLDLTDHFLEHRAHEKGPLYCLQDTHWSGVACVLAAEQIAKRLNLGHDPRADYTPEWRDVEITGDLWRMLNDPGRARETVSLRPVSGETTDPESPIVLLGDSHGLVFQEGGDMHYRHAGLAAQLALALGTPVDLNAVRGSGATPARMNLFRRAQRDADYWDNKKAVVWVFSAREFTESDGWRVLPIAP